MPRKSGPEGGKCCGAESQNGSLELRDSLILFAGSSNRVWVRPYPASVAQIPCRGGTIFECSMAIPQRGELIPRRPHRNTEARDPSPSLRMLDFALRSHDSGLRSQRSEDRCQELGAIGSPITVNQLLSIGDFTLPLKIRCVHKYIAAGSSPLKILQISACHASALHRMLWSPKRLPQEAVISQGLPSCRNRQLSRRMTGIIEGPTQA